MVSTKLREPDIPPTLEESRSAVGVDGLAGYEAAFVADEEHDGAGNLINFALTLHRDVRGVRRAGVGVPLRMFPGSVDATR